jgi:ABC-type multidrug transport system fused ATPase/permease subunit
MGRFNVRVKHDDYKYIPGAEPEQEHVSLRRLLAESRPERRVLLWATCALFVSAGCNLAIPALFGRIIDTLTVPATGNTNADALTQAVVLLVFVSVAGAVFSFLRGWLFSVAGERVVARLRTKLFHALMVSVGCIWHGAQRRQQ